MDLALNGKRALVTCAGSGVGAACAHRLQAEGAQVIGLCRTPPDEMQPTATGIQWVSCDITDIDAVLAVARTLPLVDILVYVPVREPASSILRAGSTDYVKALNRCFYPCLALIQEFLPGMAERSYGRIINLVGTSVVAPLWDHTLSNVARMATVILCHGAAREFAAAGVSFNTIVLGLIDTPGLKSLWESRTTGDSPGFLNYAANRISQIPGERLGDPDQCAMLCALLASPGMGYLNGQCIRLDSGQHLGL